MSDVGRARRTDVIYRRISAPEAREEEALPIAFADAELSGLSLSARLLIVHRTAQQLAPPLLWISDELRARLAGVTKPAEGGRRGKARKQVI